MDSFEKNMNKKQYYSKILMVTLLLIVMCCPVPVLAKNKNLSSAEKITDFYLSVLILIIGLRFLYR